MHIEDKTIIARTRHVCRVCGEVIAAGESCHMYRGTDDNGFYRTYFHHDCWTYSRDWCESDWEVSGPGDVSHDEVREAVVVEITPAHTQEPTP